MKPSYEQLEQELHTTKQELRIANEKIAKLEELLRQALNRIAELENQIGRNSKNSSKPPSTDQKSNTHNNLRLKKKRSHAGKSRAPYPPEQVDQHIACTRVNCPYCKSTQLQVLHEPPVVWQQVELPPVQAIVTQFECQRYRCTECDKRSIGSLPDGVPYSAFGPKLMALIASLTGRFHMAKRDAMLLVSDLYGIELSEGSIINIEERDLRKIVLWRKKSYGSRSARGQRFVERISSVVETIKKNSRNVLSFLEEAVRAFYHKQPPPYIAAEMGI